MDVMWAKLLYLSVATVACPSRSRISGSPICACMGMGQLMRSIVEPTGIKWKWVAAGVRKNYFQLRHLQEQARAEHVQCQANFLSGPS